MLNLVILLEQIERKETHYMFTHASKLRVLSLLIALLVAFSTAALAQNYRLGDEDEEIANIQSALKQLKYYNGDVTGHFGAKTQEAVVKFQKRFNLDPDGIVGEDTLDRLYTEAGITVTAAASSSSKASSSMNSSPVMVSCS